MNNTAERLLLPVPCTYTYLLRHRQRLHDESEPLGIQWQGAGFHASYAPLHTLVSVGKTAEAHGSVLVSEEKLVSTGGIGEVKRVHLIP